MDEVPKLKRYLALADGAFRDASLYVRLNEEEAILSEARKHLTRNEFQELEKYVFEKLVKLVNVN